MAGCSYLSSSGTCPQQTILKPFASSKTSEKALPFQIEWTDTLVPAFTYQDNIADKDRQVSAWATSTIYRYTKELDSLRTWQQWLACTWSHKTLLCMNRTQRGFRPRATWPLLPDAACTASRNSGRASSIGRRPSCSRSDMHPENSHSMSPVSVFL